MKSVFTSLPKAIRWSNIVANFLLFFAIIQIPIFFANFKIKDFVIVLISFSLFSIGWWLIRGYKIACKQALASQNEDDLIIAARKQVNVIKFFGFFSLIFLVLIISLITLRTINLLL